MPRQRLAGQSRPQAAGAATVDATPGPWQPVQPGGCGLGSGQSPSAPVETHNRFGALETWVDEADEEVDACGAKTEAMERGDDAGGQQEELSPAGANSESPVG